MRNSTMVARNFFEFVDHFAACHQIGMPCKLRGFSDEQRLMKEWKEMTKDNVRVHHAIQLFKFSCFS